MTLLHEENHVGDHRAGRAYTGPDPNRQYEPGNDFIDDVYHQTGTSSVDIDFNVPFSDPDWQDELLGAGKRIRKDKKDRSQGSDLPSQNANSQNQDTSDMSWDDFKYMLLRAVYSNPDIKVIQ